MSTTDVQHHKDMIERVATALGAELLSKVAFIGGCTTGLHLTDAMAKESVRHTKDVDLIVPVIGRVEWQHLQERLRAQGFHDSLHEEAPLCALFLGDLRVDFMPYDADILGFTNRWYEQALERTLDVQVGKTTVRLVAPHYFLATKFEAYRGRGNGDVWASTDIEDIIAIFYGRPEIVEEVAAAPEDLKVYLQAELDALLDHPHIDYAIQSTVNGDVDLMKLIYSRMEKAAGH